MKKTLLLLLLFNILSISIQAQNSSNYLKESKRLPSLKTNITHTLLHLDSSNFYTLRFNKKFTYPEIEQISKEQLKVEQKYVLHTSPRHKPYTGVLNLRGKVYLLFFNFSKTQKNHLDNSYKNVSLYAQKLDSKTFELAEDSIELIAPFQMRSNYYQGNFDISPDKTKILVYDYEEEGDVENVSALTNIINVRVFDSHFNLLWKRRVNLSTSSSSKRLVSIKKARVNNQGDIVILTDIFRDQRSYELKKVSVDPCLFFVGRAPNSYAKFSPKLKEQYYNNLNILFDQESNLHCYGFYSKQNYFKQGGLFYLKVNAQHSAVLEKKHYDFSESFLKNVLQKKRIKEGKELKDYRFVFQKLDKNQHLILSAEQQPYGEQIQKTHSILVFNLDSSAQLKWARSIYKYNELNRRLKSLLSHYILLKESNVYVLYNNGYYSQNAAVATRIDAEGQLLSRSFYKYNNRDNIFCPKLSFWTGSKLFINLQNRYLDHYRYATIDIEKLFQ